MCPEERPRGQEEDEMRSRRRIAGAVIAGAVALGSVGAVAFATGAAAESHTSHESHMTHMAEASATKTAVFHDQMRRLWENHVAWTRLYIVSAAASLPDQNATAARLLENQTAIGNAIKPFYGNAAGNQLTELLRDHILTAAAMIEDAKAGNTDKFDHDSKHWYANANQIAGFLHRANPANWPLDDMRSMMKEHLDLTLTEAVDRLQGHWLRDVRDYRPIETAILHMADMLSAGIVAQFPDRF